MEFITAKQAAEKWGITANRITILCKGGRIPGAAQIGAQWMIPVSAEKPADGRTRQVKAEPGESFFRFPLYVNAGEKEFMPPLTKEEAALRRAQKDFYACEFQRAREAFELLCERAESIYIKICAAFYMCALSASYDTAINWQQYYYRLNLLLSENTCHRRETELFLPWLDAILGRFKSIAGRIPSDPTYNMHPSAWYLNAFLSVYCYADAFEGTSPSTSEPFETLCRLMERDGHYVEAQGLHQALFLGYFYTTNTKSMKHHLKKMLDIAYEHELLFTAADIEYYYSEVFGEALAEYPPEFAEKIKKYSRLIYGNFARFAGQNRISDLYDRLSREDYRFVLYAYNGYTNKQIADAMRLSKRLVAYRYNAIYDNLGVTGRSELVALLKAAFGENRQ